jgi:hypothetical protein
MSKISRFASLVGFGATKADDKDDEKPEAGKKADKPTQDEGESDEDFQKRLKKWEDENPDGKKKGEGPKDTSDDDQDDGEKLKAARAEGVAAGIATERARWSAVLASPEAAGKAVNACDFLGDTDLEASAITKMLGKISAPTGRSTLAERQKHTATPAPGIEGGEDPAKQDGPKGFAARMSATMDRIRPAKKS